MLDLFIDLASGAISNGLFDLVFDYCYVKVKFKSFSFSCPPKLNLFFSFLLRLITSCYCCLRSSMMLCMIVFCFLYIWGFSRTLLICDWDSITSCSSSCPWVPWCSTSGLTAWSLLTSGDYWKDCPVVAMLWRLFWPESTCMAFFSSFLELVNWFWF